MGLSREESFHCLGQLNSDLLPRRLFTWLENQCCYLLGAQLELRVGCGREGSKSFHMSFPWPVSASSWHSDKVLRVSVSRGQEVVKPFMYWFWKSYSVTFFCVCASYRPRDLRERNIDEKSINIMLWWNGRSCEHLGKQNLPHNQNLEILYPLPQPPSPLNTSFFFSCYR